MIEDTIPPKTTEELREQIVARFAQLSKRLQQIGQFVLDEPNDIALETLAVIANRCGTQPSAIVRFAKTFGFEGASQMQKLYRDSLISTNDGLAYTDRVRRLKESIQDEGGEPKDILAEFVEGNRLALEQLLDTVSEENLETAVRMIAQAEVVHVAGFRRSFPVASYLAYSLLQVGKAVILNDGVAGLSTQYAKSIRETDLLIAISFSPYAEETIAVTEIAHQRNATVLTISDSLVSPIAKLAELSLLVRESDVRGFRSLSTSMCLAQALVINFALSAAPK